MTRRIPGPRRAAFTMVELLVVILIIAVLAAILLPAVNKVRIAAKRTQAATEIGQLGTAIQAFKTKYRVTYIPSSIILREDGAYSTAAELASQAYLKNVWPQLQTQVDWNGDSTITTGAAGTYTLEGDQCLVFFLGGIQMNGGANGFSSNPRNPADTTSLGAPFYEFRPDRLFPNGNPASTIATNPFKSYIDPWNQLPYAYFSNYGKKNGYNSTTDCPTIGANLYKDASGNYVQPNGYQIVSAGANKQFGTGGTWGPGVFDQESADGDNITNFHAGPLSSE